MEISRVTRSRSQAATSYNKMSRWYDQVAGRFERKYREAALDILSAKKGEIILEVGFGTGHSVVALAQATGTKGKIYGIDISEKMCTLAQKKVDLAGLTAHVSLACGDAYMLPYADCFFDAVFMSFTLDLFDTPDIPLVLQECKRTMKHGGRIVIAGMSKTGKNSLTLRIYE